MTDEQQETIVNEVLRKFVEYLNMWWDAEPMNKDEKSPYTVEKFTIMDPERRLYGETNWKVLEEPNMEHAFPTGLIKIDTTDGDEGGGNELYVGLQGDDLQISWIVHIFDLQPVLMWDEIGGFRKP